MKYLGKTVAITMALAVFSLAAPVFAATVNNTNWANVTNVTSSNASSGNNASNISGKHSGSVSVTTGNVEADSSTLNVVNSNFSSVKGVSSEDHSSSVKNKNGALVKNTTSSNASSGYNESGISGNHSGSVTVRTGSALGTAGTVNVVNTNITFVHGVSDHS